jgi:serine/threonine-protein kinase HipA
VTTVAEVRLWGKTIGAVSLADGETVADFQYESVFAASRIEVSPLTMPLATRVYRFPELAPNTFYGLPGMLADSLPDRFGHALVDAWLASQGRTPDSFNAVERLCYTGARGMGALEFRPARGPAARHASPVEIDRLVELASEILTHRNSIDVSFAGDEKKAALTEILRVGTSAGGARAKAVIAWNPDSNEVRSGQVTAGKGFQYWVLKFDGVSGNRDKELEDPQGYGVIEYAYARMAKDAGIEMSECRLFEESGRRHFMSRRFDRTDDGDKLHMQSLCGLAHFDYNLPGAYSYEQAMLAMRRLGLPMESIEEQFRRMAFNVVARNQDDHVKNIAFLMDKTGRWSLSPAFDITYSYNPAGRWTAAHQMTINGKNDDFGIEDFRACAKAVSMKRGRAEALVDEVRQVVSRWTDYADEAGVDPAQRDKIRAALRLELA